MVASPLDKVAIPDGFRLHTENTSHILLSANDAFLNPVQEFNRDISISCIRTWSEDLNRAKEEKWRHAQEKKASGAVNSAKKKLKGMVYEFVTQNIDSTAARKRRTVYYFCGSF